MIMFKFDRNNQNIFSKLEKWEKTLCIFFSQIKIRVNILLQFICIENKDQYIPIYLIPENVINDIQWPNFSV